MKLTLVTGLAAGLLAVAAPAHAAPSNVTVRVEGAGATLVDTAPVTTTAQPVVKDGHDCSGTSAGGALDRATAGRWEAAYSDGLGHFVTSIMGEAPTGSGYWSLWVNHKYALTGACALELQEGDDVLFLLDRCDDYDPATQSCRDQVLPLGLSAPATAGQGVATEVSVVRYRPDGTPSPAAGARITGPGVDAVTDAAGRAALTFAQPGSVRIRAELAGAGRSEARTIQVAGASAAPLAVDRTPPAAIRLSHTRRELRGSFAPDPSGIRTVKLRLTKRLGKRCWYFSGRMEKFRRTRCGTGAYFAIGDRADWSYLLPRRLGRGRYVLDAVAIDGAGNRTPIVRGRTREVFTLR